MTELNRVVKNTWILYIRMAITVFISLYATRLTLSALGITDFGIFNLVGGVVAMLTFLNNAMASASQRFMSFAEGAGDDKKQKEIFNVSTVLHVIIAILVFLVLEIAGYFLFDKVLEIPAYRSEIAKMILQFMVVSTVFTIISVPYDAVINTNENMLLFAILSVLESVFKLGIALFLSVTPYDKLTTYGLLMALLSIILLFIRQIYCHRKYKECEINFKKYFSKNTFNEMTSFAGWSFLGAFSSAIANYGQGIVLNVFFGPIVNAAQGISSQVGGQLGTFAMNMMKSVNPIIAKSEGSGDRSLMIDASNYSAKFAFFLLMLFVTPVYIEMPFIFKLWLKEVPLYTIIFCRLLLIRMLIEQLYIPLSTAISAVGNIKMYQIYSSILNIVPLLFAFTLFKLGYQPETLYVIFIIYSVLSFVITIYFAKINYDLSINYFLKKIVSPTIIILLVVTLFSSVPLILLDESFSRLLIVIMSTTLISFVGIWFGGLSFQEQNKVSTILKQKLKFRKSKLIF